MLGITENFILSHSFYTGFYAGLHFIGLRKTFTFALVIFVWLLIQEFILRLVFSFQSFRVSFRLTTCSNAMM